jgi:hypothetical protein
LKKTPALANRDSAGDADAAEGTARPRTEKPLRLPDQHVSAGSVAKIASSV